MIFPPKIQFKQIIVYKDNNGMYKFVIITCIILLCSVPASCEEIKFILHDRCINLLYKPAIAYFNNSGIDVMRDSRGILIRFKIQNPAEEYTSISEKTKSNIKYIEKFLAKIKNVVIIEVHTAKITGLNEAVRNWEVSAVIAGNIERAFLNENVSLRNRIHSIGYGEFLPENNTPNNGGKLLNRVDIIILCNISGE